MTRPSSPPANWLGGIREFLEMIKVSHTLFAMPFAIGALFLANRDLAIGAMDLMTLLIQVVVAVALARTSAMSFNRWADRKIDALNPRTSGRSIPAGRLGASTVLWWTVCSGAGFVAVTATINPLALKLSPVVLLIILGYSWTKRFTSLCHMVLGLGLALAPIGAWVAVTVGAVVADVAFGIAREAGVHLEHELIHRQVLVVHLRIIAAVATGGAVRAFQRCGDCVVEVEEHVAVRVTGVHVERDGPILGRIHVEHGEVLGELRVDGQRHGPESEGGRGGGLHGEQARWAA